LVESIFQKTHITTQKILLQNFSPLQKTLMQLIIMFSDGKVSDFPSL